MSKRIIIVTQSIGSEVEKQRSLAEFDYEVLVTKLFLTESMLNYKFFIWQFDVLLLSEHMLENRTIELAEEWNQINPSAPVILLSQNEMTTDFKDYCQRKQIIPLFLPDFNIYKLITEFETAIQKVPSSSSNEKARKNNYYMQQETHDEQLYLSKKETILYNLLSENKGSPVSSEKIFETIWGNKSCKNKNIHVAMLIRRLRNKMSDDPKTPQYIRNVYNSGYLLTNKWNDGATYQESQEAVIEEEVKL